MKFVFSLITLYILIHSFSSNATIESIKRQANDDIIISGDNCDEIFDQMKSIAKWKELIGEGKCNLSKQNLISTTTNSCHANITNCLPKHVRKYHDTSPDFSGPNCWNLSLIMANILPNLRHSPEHEMAYYVRPPLCRQLKNGEARRPGDIGAIRYMDKENGNEEYGFLREYHGFIYVSEKLTYSKNGAYTKSPYALQSLNDVYKVYKIDELPGEECTKNQLNPKCAPGTEFYRCISMKEYLKKENVPQIETKLLDHIDSISCGVSDILFDKRLLRDTMAMNNIKDITAVLDSYISDVITDTNIDSLKESDAFVLGAAKLRLESLKYQIGLIYGRYVFSGNDEGQFDTENLPSTSHIIDLFTHSEKELETFLESKKR